jgi:hypothetical protein
MSSFDPMAAAIDWLDAYRASDLSIADLYSVSAALECCNGQATVVGRAAITEYWRLQFAESPAGELEGLQAEGDELVVSYAVPGEVRQTALEFGDTGEIVKSRCRHV